MSKNKMKDAPIFGSPNDDGKSASEPEVSAELPLDDEPKVIVEEQEKPAPEVASTKVEKQEDEKPKIEKPMLFRVRKERRCAVNGGIAIMREGKILSTQHFDIKALVAQGLEVDWIEG